MIIDALTRFILWLLFRKEIYDMALIYAILIMKGRKVYADVPEKLKEKVKSVLIDMELEELAQ